MIAAEAPEDTVRIRLTSIIVEDQERALAFYTRVLGFRKKQEIPMGPFKWLSVVSPLDPDGVELSLEPNVNPAGKTFQQAMFAQKIPVAAFEVDKVEAEYERLASLGVDFAGKPMDAGAVRLALFDDTCGNYIQIYQHQQQP